tara:strand:- start:859 stop:2280 length:1422 start_codon:yes stop_codon:yes gene_type:complete
MTSTSELIDATPSAALLIESIRDIGYSLETAIADLVDNSISAGAKNIDILLINDADDKPFLSVEDDGEGMTEDELLSAMRLGSKDPNIVRAKDDLGRFGLGLKTASFSQCRQLTVESNKLGKSTSMTWDLDLVKEKNLWVVRKNYPKEIKLGTKIIWEKIDRTNLEINSVYTNLILNNISEHLSLVFHRFIDGVSSSNKKVNISINGNLLDSYNPFNENNLATIKSEKRVYSYKGGNIKIQSFILPSRLKIDHEEWRKYEGEGGYAKNQGFYVYRANRLIIKGTWFGLLKKSEFTKLCRVRIDIDNDLDTDWKIDVKKSKASPPKQIRDFLGEFMASVEIQGKKVYFRVPQKSKDDGMPIWQKVSKDSKSYYVINRSHPLINKFLSEKKNNLAYLKLFENTIPYYDIFSLLSSDKESVVTWQEENEEDLNSIKELINLLKKSKMKSERILTQIESFLKDSDLNITSDEIKKML